MQHNQKWNKGREILEVGGGSHVKKEIKYWGLCCGIGGEWGQVYI